MQLDLGLIVAAIAGAGTVLGTLVAAEKYTSSKFRGAVVSVLRELEYDRKLRHLERDLQALSLVLAKVQDKDMELDSQIAQVFAVLNAQKISQARLESAARVLGSKLQGDASITAILMDNTEG